MYSACLFADLSEQLTCWHKTEMLYTSFRSLPHVVELFDCCVTFHCLYFYITAAFYLYNVVSFAQFFFSIFVRVARIKGQQFDSFIDFSHKAHKSWLAHI